MLQCLAVQLMRRLHPPGATSCGHSTLSGKQPVVIVHLSDCTCACACKSAVRRSGAVVPPYRCAAAWQSDGALSPFRSMPAQTTFCVWPLSPQTRWDTLFRYAFRSSGLKTAPISLAAPGLGTYFPSVGTFWPGYAAGRLGFFLRRSLVLLVLDPSPFRSLEAHVASSVSPCAGPFLSRQHAPPILSRTSLDWFFVLLSSAFPANNAVSAVGLSAVPAFHHAVFSIFAQSFSLACPGSPMR